MTALRTLTCSCRTLNRRVCFSPGKPCEASAGEAPFRKSEQIRSGVCFHSESCFRVSLDEINRLQQMQLMQKIVPTTNQPVLPFFFVVHCRLTATARRQSTRSVCHGWRTTKSVSSCRCVSAALHRRPETAEQSAPHRRLILLSVIPQIRPCVFSRNC